MRTLKGESVDRPPVCFYEINGLTQNPEDPDPYNVFNHPSWRPVIDLARDVSDRIVLCGVASKSVNPDPLDTLGTVETEEHDGSRHTVRRIEVGGRVLTQRTRRDRDVDTVWFTEHLLKDRDDLEAFLSIPEDEIDLSVDDTKLLSIEAELGDTGIVAIDTADPLCEAAGLFDMGTYTVLAMTEPELFRRLLARFARKLLPRTEEVARSLPGRLWRIYGPEYASEPYLPPSLFDEYVCTYVRPMVASIQRYGGFARIHSHGNLTGILDSIAALGADGLDPIEPPPQGDVELRWVRERYGESLVLFGNIEASELENLDPESFRRRVDRAVEDGTHGRGRGFVLMPSSCPYGREIEPRVVENYESMVRAVGAL